LKAKLAVDDDACSYDELHPLIALNTA
jgi:hypothetical protein